MSAEAIDDDVPSPAVALAATHLRRWPGIDLERVLEVAQLTTRHDRKYLVPLGMLDDVLGAMPADLAVLDIEGRRVFAYESAYFDTDGFDLFRHHVQGRRRRFKARTRSYCDSAEAMLEVKLKGYRGQTVKERTAYDFGRRGELTAEGRGFVEQVVTTAYDVPVPELAPALTTSYQRLTLIDPRSRLRLTVDVDLAWDGRVAHHTADHVAVIESKSLNGPGPADRVLHALGLRPVQMSKYCLGVALLHPELAANPWHRLLRRHFGWERAAA